MHGLATCWSYPLFHIVQSVCPCMAQQPVGLILYFTSFKVYVHAWPSNLLVLSSISHRSKCMSMHGLATCWSYPLFHIVQSICPCMVQQPVGLILYFTSFKVYAHAWPSNLLVLSSISHRSKCMSMHGLATCWSYPLFHIVQSICPCMVQQPVGLILYFTSFKVYAHAWPSNLLVLSSISHRSKCMPMHGLATCWSYPLFHIVQSVCPCMAQQPVGLILYFTCSKYMPMHGLATCWSYPLFHIVQSVCPCMAQQTVGLILYFTSFKVYVHAWPSNLLVLSSISHRSKCMSMHGLATCWSYPLFHIVQSICPCMAQQPVGLILYFTSFKVYVHAWSSNLLVLSSISHCSKCVPMHGLATCLSYPLFHIVQSVCPCMAQQPVVLILYFTSFKVYAHAWPSNLLVLSSFTLFKVYAHAWPSNLLVLSSISHRSKCMPMHGLATCWSYPLFHIVQSVCPCMAQQPVGLILYFTLFKVYAHAWPSNLLVLSSISHRSKCMPMHGLTTCWSCPLFHIVQSVCPCMAQQPVGLILYFTLFKVYVHAWSSNLLVLSSISHCSKYMSMHGLATCWSCPLFHIVQSICPCMAQQPVGLILYFTLFKVYVHAWPSNLLVLSSISHRSKCMSMHGLATCWSYPLFHIVQSVCPCMAQQPVGLILYFTSFKVYVHAWSSNLLVLSSISHCSKYMPMHGLATCWSYPLFHIVQSVCPCMVQQPVGLILYFTLFKVCAHAWPSNLLVLSSISHRSKCVPMHGLATCWSYPLFHIVQSVCPCMAQQPIGLILYFTLFKVYAHAWPSNLLVLSSISHRSKCMSMHGLATCWSYPLFHIVQSVCPCMAQQPVGLILYFTLFKVYVHAWPSNQLVLSSISHCSKYMSMHGLATCWSYPLFHIVQSVCPCMAQQPVGLVLYFTLFMSMSPPT